MVYKQVRINITKKQLNQALNGKPIRLLSSQIGNGDIALSLHPANIRIIEKAVLKGKGCNLHLSEGELLSSAEDMNGEGLFGDIFKGLKSGYSWVKKNIIDSDIYQKALKPIVRRAVDTGLNVVKGSAPELGTAIDMARDQIGSKTGAFGVKRVCRKKRLAGSGLYLS